MLWLHFSSLNGGEWDILFEWLLNDIQIACTHTVLCHAHNIQFYWHGNCLRANMTVT